MEKQLTYYSVVMVLSVLSLLQYTNCFAQNQDNQELEVLESNIQSAERLISNFIRNQHQQARVFAETYANDLALIASGDFSDEELIRVEVILDRDFPDYYAYSVMSEKKEFYPEDFGEHVGETCKSDMMAFYKRRTTAVYEPRIHPHSGYYHYDTVVPWKTKDAHGLFMVSYGPKKLIEFLSLYPSDGKELIVINREIEGLIEFNQQGARDVMNREYFLSKEEKKQLYFQRKIPHTRWDIAYLLNGKVRQLNNAKLDTSQK